MAESAMFDGDDFRRVLGHFPTGVTVITAMHHDEPVGFTIGSFTSVSLDPPLVGFLPVQGSGTWDQMADSGNFCVNILGHDQGDLCWQFATTGNEHERFAGVAWNPAPSGSPIIQRAVAWIDCSVETVYDMGDHHFVLGRVTSLETHKTPDGEDPYPLLFFRGNLGRFANEG